MHNFHAMHLHRLFSFGTSPARSAATPPPPPLALALQGGGALGAFTWGVLDRLLEEKTAFTAVSGASSGAVNALLAVSGLHRGGPGAARARLARFWRRVSDRAGSPLASAGFRTGLALVPRIFSPYQFNPFGLNPLRDLLADEIDFAAVAATDIRLMVAATRVRDGGLRLFRNRDLGVEAVLASAALPMIHHAVEIDGEWYWDGGYAANPPLVPLIAESQAAELLVVQIVPTSRETLPRTPREINARLAQMAFNRPLLSELETIAALKRQPQGEGDALGGRLQRLRLHLIRAEDSFAGLAEVNALDLRWDFLVRLRDAGRSAAQQWLASRPAADAAA